MNYNSIILKGLLFTLASFAIERVSGSNNAGQLLTLGLQAAQLARNAQATNGQQLPQQQQQQQQQQNPMQLLQSMGQAIPQGQQQPPTYQPQPQHQPNPNAFNVPQPAHFGAPQQQVSFGAPQPANFGAPPAPTQPFYGQALQPAQGGGYPQNVYR